MNDMQDTCATAVALAPADGLVGGSTALAAVRRQIEVAARYEEPVLIVGETGTGKEVVARAIHGSGPRQGRRLHVVNCGAVPDDVLTAELFGHRAGAFTGAHRARAGRIRTASGSSLFLDEISETSPQFQVSLLRVVDRGEVQPIGEDRDTDRVDVRFIAATNRRWDQLQSERGFRSDLLYRISAFLIQVPPLRDRLEDIPALVEHFCADMQRKYDNPWSFSGAAMALLRNYEFPGNVRELRHIVFAACVSSRVDRVTASRVADVLGRFAGKRSRRAKPAASMALQPLLRQHLEQTILVAEGNLSQAARLLEVPRSTLQHMLARHGIDVGNLREETLQPGATPVVASESPYVSLNV